MIQCISLPLAKRLRMVRFPTVYFVDQKAMHVPQNKREIGRGRGNEGARAVSAVATADGLREMREVRAAEVVREVRALRTGREAREGE
jgi:hypothetical protein